MVDPSEQRPSRDKKRVIEFDMFVDDLEPEKSEEIRGGGGKGQTRQPKQGGLGEIILKQRLPTDTAVNSD
jgi:hypothetical protein